MVPAGVVVFCLSFFVVSLPCCYGLRVLSCVPCYNMDCPELGPNDCSLGKVLHECGCCYECAKGHGDPCGGFFSFHGQCAKGLVCQKTSDDRITIWRGVCLKPEEVESYRPSIYAPAH